MFIIGVFFYTIFNLNEVHNSQKHRYDQIRRVEKLKEYNNSFSWIVLDLITDYEKMNIVKKRLEKVDELFENLSLQKKDTINNSESIKEKENLELIFLEFENINKVVSREDIVNQTSLKKDTKNRTIDMHVSNIRFKINDDFKETKYIKSVWGIGYKFTNDN